MWIYDAATPRGRELPNDRRRETSGPVKVRFLSDAERKQRGWEHVRVRKKKCATCGEVRSDYHFFPSKKTKDGLSASCRRCLLTAKKPQRRCGGEMAPGAAEK